YNGSIGMTYEKGGISAGLGVIDDSKDTVTLVGRVQNHFTTSLSTVEISAANKENLVSAFKKYFDNSRAGNISTYKTFVMTAKEPHVLEALAALLKKNDIQFGTITKNTAFKGFDYATKKEADFVNEGYTLAVSVAQAHGVMARVLLEPVTQINDSNTYDITAWSLPYVFGVHGYATKDKLAVQNGFALNAVTIDDTKYGYVIPYNSFKSAKVLAALLSKNIKVRYAEKPFTNNGVSFEAGALIVLKTSNSDNWAADTKAICEAAQLQATAVNSGWSDKGSDFGSPDIKIINRAPKVAMFTGENVLALTSGEVWSYFDQQLNYPITQLNFSNLNRIDLNNYDVIIAADGAYKDINGKAATEKLQAFVKKGGVLIALESAAKLLASNSDWGVKAKELPKEEQPTVNNVSKYGKAVEDALQTSIPGSIYKVYMDDTHSLGYGTGGVYYTNKQDLTLYEPSNDVWNVGVIKKDSYIAGFVGVKAKAILQEGVIMGVKEIGKGKLVYLADDPMYRNFWEGGKLILANAIFFNGN
ncbi:MAG: hypothetical protein RL064_985, partial [Bacteroidota bacterium]